MGNMASPLKKLLEQRMMRGGEGWRLRWVSYNNTSIISLPISPSSWITNLEPGVKSPCCWIWKRMKLRWTRLLKAEIPILVSIDSRPQLCISDSWRSIAVSYVLLNLKKKHPLANFFRIINNRPVASSLIESSAREQDRELLKDMYYQDDRRADGALVILRESVEQEVGHEESTVIHTSH